MRRAPPCLVALVIALAGCFDAPPRPAPVDDVRAADAPDADTRTEVVDVTLDTSAPAETTLALALGREHACALVDGDAWCWGRGDDGRLGDGSATPIVRPPTPLGSAPSALALGSRHTCLAWPTHATCVGSNARGQIAAAGSPQWAPVTIPLGAVVAGYDATCTIAAGALTCRGAPLDGTPRNDDDEAAPRVAWLTPRRIQGVADLAPPEPGDAPRVALGAAFGCAVVEREVRCWGSNAHDALGRAAPLLADPDAAPTAPLGLEPVEIAAGSTFACARGSAGEVACWGDNRRFQAGAATGASRSAPGPVPLPAPASRLALGRRHACALLVDRRLACWGDNAHGALGSDATSASASPLLAPLDEVVALAAGWATTCAARADGEILCWGDDRDGQLGRGAAGPDFVATPTPVRLDAPAPAPCPGCPTVSALASGDDHVCTRVHASAPLVLCWGRGGDGRLGRGAFESDIGAPSPTGTPETRALALARATTCGLEDGGGVWCTGGGVTAPTRLALDPAVALAASGARTCAITTAGEARCWGPDRASLVVMDGLDVDDPLIAAGADATCARAADGDVVCRGANARGQLGRGHLAPVDDVAPVVDLPPATALAGAGQRFCAIADAVVWCWGANDRAALGVATTIDHAPRPAPLDLPHPVSALALGATSGCAVAAGEVHCWGDNLTAQLGLPPELAVTPRPHRVHLGFVASAVAVGRGHACAASPTGHVACWGDDAAGQLGSGAAGPAEPLPHALAWPLP
ncbi:MAG: hypothetical protein IT385_15685 [Deltaproteobacteria bacterium]|nr:hypothetical protein [Deltaproteobacteria bacterium]